MSASHFSKNIVERIKIWVKECFYFYIMVLRWCWNAVRKKKILENSCCWGKNHFFWNWIHPLLYYRSLHGGSGIYNIQVVWRQLPRHIWMLKFSHETFGHHVWNWIFAITSLRPKFTREHHPETPMQLLPLLSWPWFSELSLVDLSLIFSQFLLLLLLGSNPN